MHGRYIVLKKTLAQPSLWDYGVIGTSFKVLCYEGSRMPVDGIANRFPKVHSPFERHENDNDEYVVYNERNEDLLQFTDWVAVEKLDGTNCAIYVDENEGVVDAFTRMGQDPMQRIDPYGNTNHHRLLDAVQNSIQRGYTSGLNSGVHYGEVVGPKIQGNPHELDERLFIPFDWARENLVYESWGDYPQTFDAVSEWFEDNLFSLFYSRMHGTTFDEASVANGTFVEGIMFTHPNVAGGYELNETPNADNFAKLRRDMFEWYEGERH